MRQKAEDRYSYLRWRGGVRHRRYGHNARFTLILRQKGSSSQTTPPQSALNLPFQREVWRDYQYSCPMGTKKKEKPLNFSSLVPRTRLELARANAHYPLKVACLPISPPGPFHSWRSISAEKVCKYRHDFGNCKIFHKKILKKMQNSRFSSLFTPFSWANSYSGANIFCIFAKGKN